jgi:hypothetical protein
MVTILMFGTLNLIYFYHCTVADISTYCGYLLYRSFLFIRSHFYFLFIIFIYKI